MRKLAGQVVAVVLTLGLCWAVLVGTVAAMIGVLEVYAALT